MSNHLDKLSKAELEAEKRRINSLVKKIVIGALIYAGIIFYLMYNGNKAAGNYLLAVPVVMFVIIYWPYAGQKLENYQNIIMRRF